MRIAQFCCHIKFEITIVFDIRIAQTNQKTTTLNRNFVHLFSLGKILTILTDINVCLSKIGSRAGSSVSPTSSSNNGMPIRTQFSKIRRKCPSVILITFNAFSFSLFLIQRFACSCGSIILNEKKQNEFGSLRVIQ